MTTPSEYNKGDYRTPFFMLFPWGRATLVLLALYLGCMFVYRLSHTGGEGMSQACFAALVTALTAGTAGIYPTAKFWGQSQWRVLLGIFLGILIRMLIGTVGVVIIMLFTAINQILFVLFLKLYYLVFLVSDTSLAIWILRHSRETEKKHTAYGNLWDIVERF